MSSFAERYGHYKREQIEIMNDFVRRYGRGFSFESTTREVNNGVVQS